MNNGISRILNFVGLDPTQINLYRCKNCGFSNHHLTKKGYQDCCLNCHRDTLQLYPDFSEVRA